MSDQREETFMEVHLDQEQHLAMVASDGEIVTSQEDGTKLRIFPEGEQDGPIWRHLVVRLN